jgi:hypothetical protein
MKHFPTAHLPFISKIRNLLENTIKFLHSLIFGHNKSIYCLNLLKSSLESMRVHQKIVQEFGWFIRQFSHSKVDNQHVVARVTKYFKLSHKQFVDQTLKPLKFVIFRSFFFIIVVIFSEFLLHNKFIRIGYKSDYCVAELCFLCKFLVIKALKIKIMMSGMIIWRKIYWKLKILKKTHLEW